jgi:hypothetical protein
MAVVSVSGAPVLICPELLSWACCRKRTLLVIYLVDGGYGRPCPYENPVFCRDNARIVPKSCHIKSGMARAMPLRGIVEELWGCPQQRLTRHRVKQQEGVGGFGAFEGFGLRLGV